MEHWSLIHNQPLLKTIFTKPQIIIYEKRKSPEETHVRAHAENNFYKTFDRFLRKGKIP